MQPVAGVWALRVDAPPRICSIYEHKPYSQRGQACQRSTALISTIAQVTFKTHSSIPHACRMIPGERISSSPSAYSADMCETNTSCVWYGVGRRRVSSQCWCTSEGLFAFVPKHVNILTTDPLRSTCWHVPYVTMLRPHCSLPYACINNRSVSRKWWSDIGWRPSH